MEHLNRPDEQSEWAFKNPSKSIYIQVKRVREPMAVLLDGKTTDIPVDTNIGYLHFTPGGYTHFSYENMSNALSEGAKAFAEVFTEIDRRTTQGSTVIPAYLVGKTNKNMAHFARRVGFSIVEITFDDYLICGRTPFVRKKFDKLIKTKNITALNIRAERERNRMTKNNTQSAQKQEEAVVTFDYAQSAKPQSLS